MKTVKRMVGVTRVMSVAAAGIAMGVGLAGCNDPVKAPYAGKQDPLARTSYPQITVEGPLQPFLAFDAPVVTKPSGVLKVVTPVRLQSDGQESNVQYRYIFLDAGGMPLRAQADWRYLRMPSRQQVFLEGNALDTTASDWRLEVRPSR